MAYKLAAPGIYQDSRTGHFYERPKVRGRRTWRRLDGHNLKLARESYAQRRADTTRARLGLARDPYRPKPQKIGALIERYQADGCPKRNGQPRAGANLANVIIRLANLAPFWAPLDPEELDPEAHCAAYAASRARRRRQTIKTSGGPGIDLDLQTLAAVLHHARRLGFITTNPLSENRPKFSFGPTRHCRDLMPANADELHRLAAYLFEDKISAPLGWQVLLEAFTGCRTAETLALRWDAGPRQPGHIDESHLWLARAKGGINPFAFLHPALRACLAALRTWRDATYPRSPWFIPSSRRPGQPLQRQTLSLRLPQASRLVLGHQVTSHGLRAFYVTVRRSQGISDGQIAAEIGDASGAGLIASTYGAIPPNWQGAAPLDWMPTEGTPAAWLTLPHTIPHTISAPPLPPSAEPQNIISLATAAV